MEDILASIRKILSEDEGEPKPAAPAPEAATALESAGAFVKEKLK